jgi:WGR domain
MAPKKKDTQVKKRDAKAKDKAKASLDKAAGKPPKIEPKTAPANGPVQVDALVPNSANYTVHVDGEHPYSCYLMWSDVKDNHNKFYIMQVLRASNGSYSYWNRYGRVGYDGVSSL